MNETNNQDLKAAARAELPAIEEVSKDHNSILTTAEIPAWAHTHVVAVDGVEGADGLKHLILSILRTAGAVFPKDSHLGPLRSTVIANSLTCKEILSEVKRRFTAGSKRHQFHSVSTYVTKRMSLEAGLIGKFTPTQAEVPTGRKGECRYYVVAD